LEEVFLSTEQKLLNAVQFSRWCNTDPYTVNP